MKFLRVRMLRNCGSLQAGHEYNIVRGDAERYIQHGDAELPNGVKTEKPANPVADAVLKFLGETSQLDQKVFPANPAPKKEPAKRKLKLMPKKAEHKAPLKKTAPRKRA
jgi:hypothetical protein